VVLLTYRGKDGKYDECPTMEETMLQVVAAKPSKDRETDDMKPKEHHERAMATLPDGVRERTSARQRRNDSPSERPETRSARRNRRCIGDRKAD
jgi:hypothetical protein